MHDIHLWIRLFRNIKLIQYPRTCFNLSIILVASSSFSTEFQYFKLCKMNEHTGTTKARAHAYTHTDTKLNYCHLETKLPTNQIECKSGRHIQTNSTNLSSSRIKTYAILKLNQKRDKLIFFILLQSPW